MGDEQTITVPMSVPMQQGVPVPGRQDRADLIDKIKPEQVVEIMRHKLMGEDYDGNRWTKIECLKEKALSERGAWDIANLMLPSSSINVSISKLKTHQINARLRNLIKEAMIMMLTSWKEYNIRDVGQFYFVKSIIFSNALVVWSQADEGSLQELLKTSISENRLVSTEKKEPGGLKRMMGMGQ